MKLGICIPHYGRPIEVERMLAVAQRAEEVGLDSVWVTDHVIVPRDVDVIYREHMLDPLAVLPWLAGVTERIALGTSVRGFRHAVRGPGNRPGPGGRRGREGARRPDRGRQRLRGRRRQGRSLDRA